jgi:hypothetical protein
VNAAPKSNGERTIAVANEQPPMTRVYFDLELRAAQRFARDPRCASAIDTLNLRLDADAWGMAFVEMRGGTYDLSDSGDAAFIFAVEHQGRLIDLVACRLQDRACATRLGIAPALGLDHIDSAALQARRLLLYNDPLSWAHGGFCGATVIDWTQARSLLADVPDIACANVDLARRVHAALAAPAPLPRLFVACAA